MWLTGTFRQDGCCENVIVCCWQLIRPAVPASLFLGNDCCAVINHHLKVESTLHTLHTYIMYVCNVCNGCDKHRQKGAGRGQATCTQLVLRITGLFKPCCLLTVIMLQPDLCFDYISGLSLLPASILTESAASSTDWTEFSYIRKYPPGKWGQNILLFAFHANV